MATVKVKRKVTEGSASVVLKAGEPYYNLHDKQLFVGSYDDEEVKDKKHIAQVTSASPKSDTISFYVGEDTDNKYEQTINGVANATNATYAATADVANKLSGQAILSTTYYGTRDPNEVSSLNNVDVGTVYVRIQE